MAKYICIRVDSAKQEITFKVINNLQIELQEPRMAVNGWHYFRDPNREMTEERKKNYHPTYSHLIEILGPIMCVELIAKEEIISADLYPHYVGNFQDPDSRIIVLNFMVIPVTQINGGNPNLMDVPTLQ